MAPRSVKTASWLLAVATVVYRILIPGGAFVLNALHVGSRGESPLLIVMAGGVGMILILPRLALTALVCFKILQGRNWARVLFLLLTGAEIYAAFWSFRLAILAGARGLLFWFPLDGAAAFLCVVGAVLLFSETANTWFREPGNSTKASVPAPSGAVKRGDMRDSHGGEAHFGPAITIRIAISILGLLVILQAVGLIVQITTSPDWSIRDPSTEGLKPLALMIPLTVILIPSAFILYMAYRRRFWALILVLVAIGLDVTVYIWVILQEGFGSGLQSYAALGLHAVELAAAALLLAPRSLASFKGRDN